MEIVRQSSRNPPLRRDDDAASERSDSADDDADYLDDALPNTEDDDKGTTTPADEISALMAAFGGPQVQSMYEARRAAARRSSSSSAAAAPQDAPWRSLVQTLGPPSPSTALAASLQSLDRHSDPPCSSSSSFAPPSSLSLPPRGELLFHSDFDGGNLARAVPCANGVEYELYVREDTESIKHRLWFHFAVTNAAQDQRVLFSIVNFSKARNLYRDGMTVLVRSRTRPVWQRIPPRNSFYYKSSRHKAPRVLSWVFTFDHPDDCYEFSYCYPYSYSFLQRELFLLRQSSHSFVKIELLCRTPQGRRVDVITIDDYASQEADALHASTRRRPLPTSSRRPVLFLTARVHPGETPSSFVMQGVLDFLSSQHPNAAALRRAATIVLVPMLNPDGVALGNYRTDASGVDMNRQWNKLSPSLEPALYHVLALMTAIESSPTHALHLYLDLHAHSSAKMHFCLCNPYDETSPAEAERHTRLLRLLEAHCLGFSFPHSVADSESYKEGCARRVIATKFPKTLSYTLEMSYFVSRPTLFDDIIMGLTSSPPPQGYYATTLTTAMQQCPMASLALPYWGHVCGGRLPLEGTPCSYANQPGARIAHVSGTSGKGAGSGVGGKASSSSSSYILDINTEQGYVEFGRGIVVSLGHLLGVKMSNMRSSVLHASGQGGEWGGGRAATESELEWECRAWWWRWGRRRWE